MYNDDDNARTTYQNDNLSTWDCKNRRKNKRHEKNGIDFHQNAYAGDARCILMYQHNCGAWDEINVYALRPKIAKSFAKTIKAS